jgi:trigger factor
MIKKLPKSQIEFEISVSWEDWKKNLDRAAAEVSEEIKIPGFRPGKVPRNLVEQKIGKATILNNAAEKAIQKSCADFIVKEKLDIIGSPKVEILEINEGKDLKYRAVVSIVPEIEIKNSYKKDVEKINKDFAKKTLTVKDEDLNLELEKLANSRVKLITVRREARKNDNVEIDFEVLMNNAPIENGISKNHPFVIGRGIFIPGFEENVIGMKEGEEKSFELNFPENYHKKDLAGKSAQFKVKMNLVQERQTPEINDDFAKSLGKFENLEALKKNIREGMEHENHHRLENEKHIQYVEKIIKDCKTDLPDILVAEETERMLREFELQLTPMGMNLDQYLQKIKKDKNELKKDWEEQARKRITSALAIKKIAETEKLEADSKEVEAEMNKTLAYYKNVKDVKKNINMEQLYKYCKEIVENDKVFEFLEKL